jgi:hypothetical protein
VNGSAGDHTQITPHDPETGEPYHNSFNVYTGKGVKFYFLSGKKEEYTVPKVNPEAVAQARWVEAYKQARAVWVMETKMVEMPFDSGVTLFPVTERVKKYPPSEEVEAAVSRDFRFDWSRFPRHVRKAWKRE